MYILQTTARYRDDHSSCLKKIYIGNLLIPYRHISRAMYLSGIRYFVCCNQMERSEIHLVFSENQTSFRHIPVADIAVWVVLQTRISEQKFSDHATCSHLQSNLIDILELCQFYLCNTKNRLSKLSWNLFSGMSPSGRICSRILEKCNSVWKTGLGSVETLCLAFIQCHEFSCFYCVSKTKQTNKNPYRKDYFSI